MKSNQKNFHRSHFFYMFYTGQKFKFRSKSRFGSFPIISDWVVNCYWFHWGFEIISVCAFLSLLCAICNIQCKCNSICIYIGHVKCQFQWTATIKYANYLKYTPRKADMLNYFNTTFQYNVFQLKYFQRILSFAVLSLHKHTYRIIYTLAMFLKHISLQFTRNHSLFYNESFVIHFCGFWWLRIFWTLLNFAICFQNIVHI